MKYVLVKWVDATMEGGWHDKEYASEITGAIAHSVGFLVAQNEQWVKLSQTTSSNEEGNLVEIPKRWITSFQELGEVVISELEPGDSHA